MQRIMIPVDFSEISEKAIDFGVAIARKSGASICFFHAFDGTERREGASKEKVMEKSLVLLEDLKCTIENNPLTSEIKCTTHFATGMFLDQLEGFLKDHPADLIVIGTRGQRKSHHSISGSSTVKLISAVKCPILVIPDGSWFRGIKKIAFATDFGPTAPDRDLEVLKFLAEGFEAELNLINIKPVKNPSLTMEELEEASRELDYFGGSENASTLEIFNRNVIKGINEYLDQNKDTDILAMLARKHSFLEHLFGFTHSEQMAFHTKIPLLVMHH